VGSLNRSSRIILAGCRYAKDRRQSIVSSDDLSLVLLCDGRQSGYSERNRLRTGLFVGIWQCTVTKPEGGGIAPFTFR
jgi:hypothetical protein